MSASNADIPSPGTLELSDSEIKETLEDYLAVADDPSIRNTWTPLMKVIARNYLEMKVSLDRTLVAQTLSHLDVDREAEKLRQERDDHAKTEECLDEVERARDHYFGLSSNKRWELIDVKNELERTSQKLNDVETELTSLAGSSAVQNIEKVFNLALEKDPISRVRAVITAAEKFLTNTQEAAQ